MYEVCLKIWNSFYSATASTNICSQVEQKQQLEKMFPMLSPEAIKNAVEKSVNVHEAIDVLLDNTIEEKGLIYMIICIICYIGSNL